MSKSLDTFRPDLLAANAAEVVKDGFKSVCVYYFAESDFKRPLTRSEAVTLSEAGLYILAVYENGFPTSGDYFGSSRGRYDAQIALQCAVAAGQPAGSVIYFAADFETQEQDLPNMDAYFRAIQPLLKARGYTVGAYGDGILLRYLTERGFISHSWLSESTGWQGYAEWKGKANITQSPSGPYLGMDIDMDSTDGNAGGFQVSA